MKRLALALALLACKPSQPAASPAPEGAAAANPADSKALLAEVDRLKDQIKDKPKTFEDLEDTSFDLVITLSPEAHHKALEWTRHMAAEVEYWPTFDATAIRAWKRSIT